MKLKFALLAAAAFLLTLSASAQSLGTWILPPNLTTNYTLLVAPNQVAEVLSLAMMDDDTASLTITVNNQSIVFGTGSGTGTSSSASTVPVPLVVAGPTTITFGRSTSSSEGSMLTYRVSQVTPQPAARNGQNAAR